MNETNKLIVAEILELRAAMDQSFDEIHASFDRMNACFDRMEAFHEWFDRQMKRLDMQEQRRIERRNLRKLGAAADLAR